jgi:hypothetical protein
MKFDALAVRIDALKNSLSNIKEVSDIMGV